MKAKTKLGMGMKRRKKTKRKRLLPVTKRGGILPILPMLGALGSLIGGAASVARAVSDRKAARRQSEGRRLYLTPYKHGGSVRKRKKARAHGDSARSKSWEFRIGRSTVYKIVQEVCEAIWKALQPIVLPQQDLFTWKQSVKDFYEEWQFPNCIDALDGKHIRIKAPPNSGSKYFCYKKFFSIVLMAICNHKYRFLWVDIGQFGSISDDGVWSETELGRCVGQESFNIPSPCELPGTNIKINHVLVADEAFPLGMNLLKPYSQKFLANGGEDADKARVFNYRLSRARRIIENAFGILASRWQILL
ncbi:PREDICTED: uncharacterized protein LOC108763317 [Trachymyrmex cornetzi]|uniref:uncharacterized protein LOC108763317 n=1 Tax=Trachymyrmex cornetzi TaxID=471704 RepID=UPI00084F7E66|nr:PREDICTED: uncharacterized protein LOC108763317 [Trachymyrmex cornetzi]